MELEISLHDLHRDGKVRVEHLVTQALLHARSVGCNSAVDMKSISGHKGRPKKWKALDVVPVRMTKEQMALDRRFF